MANTAQDFEAVFITYKDVKDANPLWSDRMIEDYLSLKRDLVLVADSGDGIQSQIDALIIRVEALESLIPDSIYTNVDHICIKNEVITCYNSDPITITLMALPEDNQVIKVKRTDGLVTIDGSGLLIDGSTTVALNLQYVGLTVVYSKAGDFWSIV